MAVEVAEAAEAVHIVAEKVVSRIVVGTAVVQDFPLKIHLY